MTDQLRIEESTGGVTFDVLVCPRASRDRLGPVSGERLKVAITAPPVEGKANAALVKLLACELGVKRAQVGIVSGGKSKRKSVRVEGLSRRALLERLGQVVA